MRIAVFGLGEAGSRIAADLAGSGADVSAYDPADVGTPHGVRRLPRPADAVEGAGVVLGITAAADAREAMAQAWPAIEEPAVYADLATAAPALEEDLASLAADKGVPFADVALMAPVPGLGLATPALASGTGAGEVAEGLNPLGASIEPIGDVAGLASARKLMRSVVTKGIAALLLESMQAAGARGDEEWLWEHIADQIASMDRSFLDRLVSGTGRHAVRRLEEMQAARELLESHGAPHDMTSATIEHLRRVMEGGLPRAVSRRGGEGPPGTR